MKQLRGKNFKGKSLEEWFKKCQPRDFWDLKTDYVSRYNAFEDYVKKEVHPLVAVGAAAHDGVFLNEHGAPHVATVINRASSLIATETCVLSAYEVYILLVAIQLHDVWNILGRTGHETQLRDHNGRIDSLLGDDSAEKKLIRQIAEAHGGKRNGNQDTIRYIVEDPVLNQTVRARFLAGILRFADEIADDSQRISPFAMQVDTIPESGKLFHKYSASLHSVIIDSKGKEIKLYYDITHTDAEQQFLKDNSKCFLIEEILHRNLKMHRERIYCMRFLMPEIEIDSISVRINVYKSTNSPHMLFNIGFRLEDIGYPSEPENGIYKLCPELADWHEGQRLDGTSLLARIAETNK